MVEIIREFLVKEEARGPFELAFGPGGAWSKLFEKCPGFRGTTLLRGTKAPRRYMVIELWDSEDHRNQALVEQKAGFTGLDADFADWTESRAEMGAFRVLAEATVRPRGKAKRR